MIDLIWLSVSKSGIAPNSIYGSTALALLVLATGCNSEPASDGFDEGLVGVLEQPTVGSNPVLDVEYLGELQNPSLPDTISYLDLTMAPGPNGAVRYFLPRSDGRVEMRGTTAPYGIDQYLETTYQHMSNATQGWEVIGSTDSTRTISARVNRGTNRYTLGAYPASVAKVTGIAAIPVASSPSTQLDIYVKYGQGYSNRIRRGRYNTTSPGIISWDASDYPFSTYTDGMTAGTATVIGSQPVIFTVLSYTTSYFSWIFPPGSSRSHETRLTATEHAYAHPEGCNDRFAPTGLMKSGAWFYGIDRYVNPATSRKAWVIARMSDANLKP